MTLELRKWRRASGRQVSIGSGGSVGGSALAKGTTGWVGYSPTAVEPDERPKPTLALSHPTGTAATALPSPPPRPASTTSPALPHSLATATAMPTLAPVSTSTSTSASASAPSAVAPVVAPVVPNRPPALTRVAGMSSCPPERPPRKQVFDTQPAPTPEIELPKPQQRSLSIRQSRPLPTVPGGASRGQATPPPHHRPTMRGGAVGSPPLQHNNIHAMGNDVAHANGLPQQQQQQQQYNQRDSTIARGMPPRGRGARGGAMGGGGGMQHATQPQQMPPQAQQPMQPLQQPAQPAGTMVAPGTPGSRRGRMGRGGSEEQVAYNAVSVIMSESRSGCASPEARLSELRERMRACTATRRGQPMTMSPARVRPPS
jgi:hypothetical protein